MNFTNVIHLLSVHCGAVQAGTHTNTYERLHICCTTTTGKDRLTKIMIIIMLSLLLLLLLLVVLLLLSYEY